MPAGQSYGDISSVEDISPGDSNLCKVTNANLNIVYILVLNFRFEVKVNSPNCLEGY